MGVGPRTSALSKIHVGTAALGCPAARKYRAAFLVCYPERSMPIRKADRHTQSKDPYPTAPPTDGSWHSDNAPANALVILRSPPLRPKDSFIPPNHQRFLRANNSRVRLAFSHPLLCSPRLGSTIFVIPVPRTHNWKALNANYHSHTQNLSRISR